MPDPTQHDWNLTPAEARALQSQLAALVDTERPLHAASIRRVLAVDVSMNRFADWLTAAAVVCEVETKRTVDASTVVRPIAFPYVPGLLSFRELPAVLEAIAAIREDFEAVVVDGHGLAHPRGLGIASHLGLRIEQPTIGLAKSRLCGNFEMPADQAGAVSCLHLEGRVVGQALRTRKRAAPIFVSIGHACRLEDAMALVLRLTDGRRIPWPVRAAHEAANQARRDRMKAQERPVRPSG